MSILRHRILLAVSAASVLCAPALDAQPMLRQSSFTSAHVGQPMPSTRDSAPFERRQPTSVSPRRRMVIGAVTGAGVGLLASLMLPVASCAHVETPDCPSAASTRARIAIGWTASGAAVGALVGALTARRSARHAASPVRLDVGREHASPTR